MFEIFITAVLAGHILGDAILQSRDMGEKKSSDIFVLFTHICIVSCVNAISAFLFLPAEAAVLFVLFNAVAHFMIDGSIWNIYKWKVKRQARKIWDTETSKAWNPTVSGNTIVGDKVYAGFKDYLKTYYAPNYQYWKDKSFYTFILVDQALHVLSFIWILKLVLN